MLRAPLKNSRRRRHREGVEFTIREVIRLEGEMNQARVDLSCLEVVTNSQPARAVAVPGPVSQPAKTPNRALSWALQPAWAPDRAPSVLSVARPAVEVETVQASCQVHRFVSPSPEAKSQVHAAEKRRTEACAKRAGTFRGEVHRV